MQVEESSQESTHSADRPEANIRQQSRWAALSNWSERSAGNVFIWPAVLVVLFLAIFPLIVSLYLSLSRFKFVPGGFEFKFVGLANYRKLLAGSEKSHFLGKLADPTPLGWLLIAVALIGIIAPLGTIFLIQRSRFRTEQ